MIPKNLEFICEKEIYQYYAIEEIGFSNSALAVSNNLYEDFGEYYSSTYLDIFTENLYENYKMTQLWIFKDQKPIGLFLGLHYPHIKTLIDENNDLAANIIGEMHLFTLPQYRKQGLATTAIPLLESLMVPKTVYPPCIIMQDDAYPLGKNLTKTLALPQNSHNGVCKENRKILNEKFSTIVNNQDYFNILLKQFPALKKSKLIDTAQTKLPITVKVCA